jgi:uncharacterized protein (TIGR03086 family)
VDMLSAFDVATEEFGRRLALVDPSSWELPTPCPSWDVHYLAAHVIGGNRFAGLVIEGVAASDAIERVMSSPQIGSDAVEAWNATAAVQRTAFCADGALERQVAHPVGEISGRTFLEFRIFDITLHAWDLARSIGVDDRLPPDLIDAVLGIVDSGPPGMGFGVTPLGLAPAHASPQERLLDLTGRV